MIALIVDFKEIPHCSPCGCTNLHCHQQRRRVPFSPHSPSHLLFAGFLWWPFWLVWGDIMFLICISLIINNVDYLFLCFLTICMSSLEKCLIRSSVHFFDWVVYFLIMSPMSCLKTNPLSVTWFANLLPLCGLSFDLAYDFLCCGRALCLVFDFYPILIWELVS